MHRPDSPQVRDFIENGNISVSILERRDIVNEALLTMIGMLEVRLNLTPLGEEYDALRYRIAQLKLAHPTIVSIVANPNNRRGF